MVGIITRILAKDIMIILYIKKLLILGHNSNRVFLRHSIVYSTNHDALSVRCLWMKLTHLCSCWNNCKYWIHSETIPAIVAATGWSCCSGTASACSSAADLGRQRLWRRTAGGRTRYGEGVERHPVAPRRRGVRGAGASWAWLSRARSTTAVAPLHLGWFEPPPRSNDAHNGLTLDGMRLIGAECGLVKQARPGVARPRACRLTDIAAAAAASSSSR